MPAKAMDQKSHHQSPKRQNQSRYLQKCLKLKSGMGERWRPLINLRLPRASRMALGSTLIAPFFSKNPNQTGRQDNERERRMNDCRCRQGQKSEAPQHAVFEDLGADPVGGKANDCDDDGFDTR